jgi:hypothetical protein
MEKIINSLLISVSIITSTQAKAPTIIQNNCLECHMKQKIPSELIYRRYLLKYSTNKNIKRRLFNYLKEPDKESSIMPKQFFLKFPQKKALNLDDATLSKSIDVYLDYFDVKKKLVLP